MTILAQDSFEGGASPRIGRSISIDHAAELLGVSRRTIYNRIRSGRLQTIRTIGGSQRVLIESMSPKPVGTTGSRYGKAELLVDGRSAL
jgi:excisionase family DNA binding protein